MGPSDIGFDSLIPSGLERTPLFLVRLAEECLPEDPWTLGSLLVGSS